MRLIHTPEQDASAAQVQAWLAAHAPSIMIALEVQAETPSARQLRLQPEPCLIYDVEGLWLAADGMKMRPDWIGQYPRLQRAGVKSEVLVRACMAGADQVTDEPPRIIDATAGLGHDGLLLAWCGAHVTLVERHPILMVLLMAAHDEALSCPYARMQQTAARMTLQFGTSEAVLAALAQDTDAVVDVVYLDPMFPKAANDKKQALVKKDMQILQRLLHDSHQATAFDYGDALLPLALQVAPRVVVKRPKLAPPLAGREPMHRWVGDACRFDGYFQA